MLFLSRPALRRTATTTRFCQQCLRYNSRFTGNREPSSFNSKQEDVSKDRAPIIFSGIQPTGIPHLGNYLGALRQWVRLQEDEELGKKGATRIFAVVDLHAITVKQPPQQLRKWRKQMLASLMAVGLDGDKSHLFYQSSVTAHSELMWLLSCNASMGYLSRMTQWKSKFQTAGTSEAAVKLGLFAYPVLQAADILLYNTTHVPVGEDQVQHLEFTREIAQGLNHVLPPSSTNNPHFTVPQTILSPAKRIMSLKDPTKKMSKSDPDPNSRILITDERDAIFKKIKGAKTDSVEGVSYDRINRPGVSNLIDLMCYMDESAGLTPHEVAKDMENVSLRALKETVAERIDKGLVDIRDRYKEIVEKERRDPDYLERIEREWAVEVNRMATERMEGIREAFGFGGRVDMEE